MSNSQFMPFHVAHPMPYIYDMEQQSEQETSMMKSYYPEIAVLIQAHVERECDKMEYEGSMMYDEYPDKTMVEQLSQKVLQQVEREWQPMNMENPALGMDGMSSGMDDQVLDNQLMEVQQWGGGRPDRFDHDHRRRDERFDRFDRRRRCGNPRECQDLTRVLLLNEIFRRRCRNGRCRGFF